jgi:hypothetical protein
MALETLDPLRIRRIIEDGEPDEMPDFAPDYDPYGAIAAQTLESPGFAVARGIASAIPGMGLGLSLAAAHAAGVAVDKSKQGLAGVGGRDPFGRDPLGTPDYIGALGNMFGLGPGYDKGWSDKDYADAVAAGMVSDVGATTGSRNIANTGPRPANPNVIPANREEDRRFRERAYAYAVQDKERADLLGWMYTFTQQIEENEANKAKEEAEDERAAHIEGDEPGGYSGTGPGGDFGFGNPGAPGEGGYASGGPGDSPW